MANSRRRLERLRAATMTARIALVQRPPVLLDRDATLQRALSCIDEAADGGAKLVAFPEAFVPGYPAWVWRLSPGPNMDVLAELHGMLAAQAVTVESEHLAEVRDRARRLGVVVGMGINELDDAGARSTLFNSYVVIGTEGETLLHHRKLVPTNPERTVWGPGDGGGLRVVDTPVGRVGVLICWENYMPLARAALYAQGLDLYLAPTWDRGPRWQGTMKHIAAESGAWVAGVASAFSEDDLPEALRQHQGFKDGAPELIHPGESVVIKPFGDAVAGPMVNEQGLLLADIDREEVLKARRSLDVTSHYARPDVLQLNVNQRRERGVTFTE